LPRHRWFPDGKRQNHTSTDHHSQRLLPELEHCSEGRCYILELPNILDFPDASIALARVLPGIMTKRHRVSGTVERMLSRRVWHSAGAGP